MALDIEVQDAVWERWRAGEPMRVITRSVHCSREAVSRHLAKSGGIRPAPRRRAALRLSLAEREEISRGIAACESARTIAARLGRSDSSISREISRNGGRGQYRASMADEHAWQLALRPKLTKLDADDELRAVVREKLHEDWSPEQISAWLRRTFSDDPKMRISHEAIYRTLYTATCPALPSAMSVHLRSGRRPRIAAVAPYRTRTWSVEEHGLDP